MFQVADGRSLLHTQVEQLIQAMATFSANNGGISWAQAIQSGLTTCRLSLPPTGSQQVKRGAGHGIAVYLSADTIDTGLVSLLLVARYFGIAAVAEQLVHQFGTSGKPFGDTEVLRAARHLGLKAGKRTIAGSRLASIPCPAIAHLQDGQYVVLARVDGEQVLLQDPREARPLSLRPLFEDTWNGTLILLTTRLNCGQKRDSLASPGLSRRFSSTGGSSARCSWRHFFCKSLPY